MRMFFLGLFVLSCVVGCAKSGTTESDADVSSTADATSTDEAIEETDEVEVAEVTPAVFKIGDKAPEFKNLAGVDDNKYSLDQFDDAKVVAVVFTCNTCPVAVAYEERLNALQKDYADKGLKVVAINVNNDEPNKLPAMKDRATEAGFEFPYLYDPTQQVARDYNAEVTPHVFLLDQQRKLVYEGPVDDNMDDPTAAKPLLREATDAVLAGTAVETAEVKPVGCGIKYE